MTLLPRSFRLPRLLLAVACCLGLLSNAAAGDIPPAHKAVTTLISAIRYGKDELAAKQLDIAGMSTALLGPEAATLSPPQRQQFEAYLAQLLRRLSFVKGRELFAYLDAVLYDQPVPHGAQVHCRCTVVVHRELKKQEIPLEWVLSHHDGRFMVVDMISAGESTVAAIREEQILPLLQQGGPAALLQAMQKKLQETP